MRFTRCLFKKLPKIIDNSREKAPSTLLFLAISLAFVNIPSLIAILFCPRLVLLIVLKSCSKIHVSRIGA